MIDGETPTRRRPCERCDDARGEDIGFSLQEPRLLVTRLTRPLVVAAHRHEKNRDDAKAPFHSPFVATV